MQREVKPVEREGADGDTLVSPDRMMPQPQGGWLYRGNASSPGSPSYSALKVKRREIRDALARTGLKRVERLEQLAEGRIFVLLGFKTAEEAAERFHELHQRVLDPEADRFIPWDQITERERMVLIQTFADMMLGKRTTKEIAVTVAPQVSLAAIDTMFKYGLGTQTVITDDEGNSLPGIVAIPQLELTGIQEQQRRILAGEGLETVEGDDGLMYVIEDATQLSTTEAPDQPPPPLEERIDPRVVEVIRRRRANNQNGKENGRRK